MTDFPTHAYFFRTYGPSMRPAGRPSTSGCFLTIYSMALIAGEKSNRRGFFPQKCGIFSCPFAGFFRLLPWVFHGFQRVIHNIPVSLGFVRKPVLVKSVQNFLCQNRMSRSIRMIPFSLWTDFPQPTRTVAKCRYHSPCKRTKKAYFCAFYRCCHRYWGYKAISGLLSTISTEFSTVEKENVVESGENKIKRGLSGAAYHWRRRT